MRTSRFMSFHICRLAFAFALTVLCSMQALAGAERILHSFSSQRRGAWPYALVSDSSGNLFGTTEYGGENSSGVVFELSPKSGGGWTETVLHSFSGGADGSDPAAIVLDPDGNIYGMTAYGGPCTDYDCPTVFKLARNSSGQWVKSVIYDFPSSVGYPNLALLVYDGGNLYGSVSYYTTGGFSSVFELTPTGAIWTETTLYTFSAGAVPNYAINGLALDSVGNIYGTLAGSASASAGLVFELTPSSGSWTETTLYMFGGGVSGSMPTGPVVINGGNLFGTTLDGGDTTCNGRLGCGVVYELIRGAGGQWAESVLFTFKGDNVGQPSSPSLGGFDPGGNLYGSSLTGGGDGCSQCGSVFQLMPAGDGTWKETTLWAFAYNGQQSVYYPEGVAVTDAGQVYGIAETPFRSNYVQGSIFELTPPSGSGGPWKLVPVYVFPFTDGQWPSPGLIADDSGNLYGTTEYGGSNNIGSVFELSPAANGWKGTVIYSFGPVSSVANFSAWPSPLVSDGKGNFYGVTELGGSDNAGSVFEMSPLVGGGWRVTTLFSFHSGQALPIGGVVFDKAGNIYGVTYQGGSHGVGTVFELTKNTSGDWQANLLHTFSGYPSDGANPGAGLAIDSAGNLYGTTEQGGSGDCTQRSKMVGCGTVFELSYVAGTGWTETLLHWFPGTRGGDGATPITSLIFDPSGNLYGTTLAGGLAEPDCAGYGYASGCGIVFELSPSGSEWNETILYEFRAGTTDGSNPYGGLTRDQSGNLYGTVESDAAYRYGGLYKLTPATGGTWTESLIYSFGSGSDGKYPIGAPIVGPSGNLYGVTSAGGIGGGVDNSGQGTVYEIKP